MSNIQVVSNYNFILECLKKDINNIFTLYIDNSVTSVDKRVSCIFSKLEQAFNQNNYTDTNVIGTIEAKRLLRVILLLKQLYSALWLILKNNNIMLCREENAIIMADSFNMLRACANSNDSSMFIEDFIKLATGTDSYSMSIRN